jgi:hypothetical protein
VNNYHGLFHDFIRNENSYLLYEFYKTPFCRTRFLEHEECSDECSKANKCDKMAYKTSIIQYFFNLLLKFKKSSKHNARKIIFDKYKGW